MVSMVTGPMTSFSLYQTVFVVPGAGFPGMDMEHGGLGSVGSVVAAELSRVSTKLLFTNATCNAFAKLSFTGGGESTVKVGNNCGKVVTPPPGGGFITPTSLVLPNCAIKLAGTVALNCEEELNVVARVLLPPGPLKLGLNITLD